MIVFFSLSPFFFPFLSLSFRSDLGFVLLLEFTVCDILYDCGNGFFFFCSVFFFRERRGFFTGHHKLDLGRFLSLHLYIPCRLLVPVSI